MRGALTVAMVHKDNEAEVELQAHSGLLGCPACPRSSLVLWAFLAILGAVALAFVTGLVNPTEKVNGLWLVMAEGCIYVLAYRFYGRWISRRVVELNDQRVTPDVRLNE